MCVNTILFCVDIWIVYTAPIINYIIVIIPITNSEHLNAQ